MGLSDITATFTGPRRKTCKQKKPRGPRLRVQRIVITPALEICSPTVIGVQNIRRSRRIASGHFEVAPIVQYFEALIKSILSERNVHVVCAPISDGRSSIEGVVDQSWRAPQVRPSLSTARQWPT
jgi:hypothetical protein